MIRELLLIFGVFHRNVLSSSVNETTKSYDCTHGKQNLSSDFAFTGCEQTWNIGARPIAKLYNGNPECHRPCSEVTPGGIVVDECANVSLTAFCEKDLKGRACYGVFACLAVFMLVALGLSLQFYRSPRNRGRRNADQNSA